MFADHDLAKVSAILSFMHSLGPLVWLVGCHPFGLDAAAVPVDSNLLDFTVVTLVVVGALAGLLFVLLGNVPRHVESVDRSEQCDVDGFRWAAPSSSADSSIASNDSSVISDDERTTQPASLPSLRFSRHFGESVLGVHLKVDARSRALTARLRAKLPLSLRETLVSGKGGSTSADSSVDSAHSDAHVLPLRLVATRLCFVSPLTLVALGAVHCGCAFVYIAQVPRAFGLSAPLVIVLVYGCAAVSRVGGAAAADQLERRFGSAGIAAALVGVSASLVTAFAVLTLCAATASGASCAASPALVRCSADHSTYTAYTTMQCGCLHGTNRHSIW
jgi:hypothetical protein